MLDKLNRLCYSNNWTWSLNNTWRYWLTVLELHQVLTSLCRIKQHNHLNIWNDDVGLKDTATIRAYGIASGRIDVNVGWAASVALHRWSQVFAFIKYLPRNQCTVFFVRGVSGKWSKEMKNFQFCGNILFRITINATWLKWKGIPKLCV